MNHTDTQFRARWRFLVSAGVLLPLAALLPFVLPAEGRTLKAPTRAIQAARNLDVGLLRQAPKIVKFLRDNQYRTVAVLPFKVKKGNRQAGYYSAPLGTNLPGRLENALIMTMGDNEKDALNIIRDAAGTANRRRVGKWSRQKTAFSRLFAGSYPMAWGSRQVRPDVFLTGVVSNTGSRAITTVEIEGFTGKSWTGAGVKRFPVARFTVKTDRVLLRDLGYNYALAARSVVRRGVTARQRDQQALQQVQKQENGQQQPPQQGQGGNTPDNVAGMAFEIYYNGARQTIRPLTQSQQGAKSPQYQVDPIPPGTKVLMVLRRVSDEDRVLGVILKVNGRSSFQQEDRDSLLCRKWIYNRSTKDQQDKLTGFWMDTQGKEVLPFKVLTTEESASRVSELGERAGWIDIDVFTSGQNQDEPMMVSTRGQAHARRKPARLAALRRSLFASNNVRQRTGKSHRRGLIVPDLVPDTGFPLNEQNLPNPVRIGGISIKYYDRSTMNVSE